MINKKGQMTMIVVVVVILVILGIGYYYFNNSGKAGTSASTSDKGAVVFAIGDPGNVEGVTNIYVTISEVDAHSTTNNWVTLASNPGTYDLIQLKNTGQLQLITNTSASSGEYDQLRLQISKVVVVNASGENDAQLPSNQIDIKTDLRVGKNSTATATFDFAADKSLHRTGNGKYILTPVINIETRDNASADIGVDNTVQITGGVVRDSEKVGTDVNGNVGVGLGVSSNQTIDLDSNGKIIVIGGNQNTNVDTSSSTGVNMNVGSSGNAGSSSSGNGY